MNIKINNITMDVWIEGSPIWFNIRDNNHLGKEVSFRFDEAKAVIDGLQNLYEFAKNKKT